MNYIGSELKVYSEMTVVLQSSEYNQFQNLRVSKYLKNAYCSNPKRSYVITFLISRRKLENLQGNSCEKDKMHLIQTLERTFYFAKERACIHN